MKNKINQPRAATTQVSVSHIHLQPTVQNDPKHSHIYAASSIEQVIQPIAPSTN